jgi:hypothetical protein
MNRLMKMVKKYSLQIGILLLISLNSLKISYNEKSIEVCPIPDFINNEINTFDTIDGMIFSNTFTKVNFRDSNGYDSIVGDYYLATIGENFVYLMTKNIGESNRPEIIPLFFRTGDNPLNNAAETLFNYYLVKYDRSRTNRFISINKFHAPIKFSFTKSDTSNCIFHIVHKNKYKDERHYSFNICESTIDYWYVKDKDSPEDYDRLIYWY